MKNINCPYCGQNMEEGVIQSPYVIVWHKGEEKRFFSAGKSDTESLLMAENSFLGGSAADAFLCRFCSKVIIDVNDDIL